MFVYVCKECWLVQQLNSVFRLTVKKRSKILEEMMRYDCVVQFLFESSLRSLGQFLPASQFGDPIPVEVTSGQIAPDVVGTGHKTQLYQKTYLARESNKELLPTAKCHPNTSLLRTLVTRS